MEKLSKESVEYEAKSKHPSRRCELCQHFMSPHGCNLVKGFIEPGGWCERFDRKEHALDAQAS